MALQPRIIACGKKQAAIGMMIRFVAGPAVMALASVAVGIRGTVLKVSIIQASPEPSDLKYINSSTTFNCYYELT